MGPSGPTSRLILFALPALALAPRPARADPEPMAHLAWVRGEGADHCPDTVALARDVVHRLGRDPFGPGAPRSIEASVAHEGGGWLARIYVRAPDGSLVGSREITSDAQGCEPVSSSIALALALMIDPEAAFRPPPPAPVAPPVVAAPTPPATPAPAPPVRRARRVRTPAQWPSLALQGLAGWPIQPGVTFGMRLQAEGPLGGRWHWMAGGSYLLPSRAPDFSLELVSFFGAACWDPWSSNRLQVALCAGAAAGTVTAVSYVAPPGNPGAEFWASVEMRARLRWRFAGSWFVDAGVEGIVPLVHRTYLVTTVFDTQRTVFTTPWVAVLGAVGVGFLFR